MYVLYEMRYIYVCRGRGGEEGSEGTSTSIGRISVIWVGYEYGCQETFA